MQPATMQESTVILNRTKAMGILPSNAEVPQCAGDPCHRLPGNFVHPSASGTEKFEVVLRVEFRVDQYTIRSHQAFDGEAGHVTTQDISRPIIQLLSDDHMFISRGFVCFCAKYAHVAALFTWRSSASGSIAWPLPRSRSFSPTHCDNPSASPSRTSAVHCPNPPEWLWQPGSP